MAKWAHPDILDGGPLALQASASKMRLVSSYTAGMSYATVVANTLAVVDMTSSDFAISASGNNRQIVTAPNKSATATAPSLSTDLHVVLTDSTSRVLLATDESTNMAFDVGTGVIFPSITYFSNQPV